MSIYDFTVKDKKGNPVSLKDYEGKVLLVINTATHCGQTPQYTALQKLYDAHKDSGFEILDFPCNQFMAKAAGSDDEINEFCSLNYGTTFPRFAKIDVNGENTDPLFVWLKEQAPEAQSTVETEAFEKEREEHLPNYKAGDVKWNFGKFLVDQSGAVVARYAPTLPIETVEEDIVALLK